jgi:hypothetical protein
MQWGVGRKKNRARQRDRMGQPSGLLLSTAGLDAAESALSARVVAALL